MPSGGPRLGRETSPFQAGGRGPFKSRGKGLASSPSPPSTVRKLDVNIHAVMHQLVLSAGIKTVQGEAVVTLSWPPDRPLCPPSSSTLPA